MRRSVGGSARSLDWRRCPVIALHGTLINGSFEKTFDLHVGNEIVGVVGANGTGKTSLLRVVAGLHCLSSGELNIDGEIVDAPTRNIFVKPESRHIGMVFQDHSLLPFLTALENVAFPLIARGHSRSTAQRLADEFVEQFGVSHVASQLAKTLSGGQSQRVAIARALIGKPKAILLDEPLSAIDEESKPEVRAIIRERIAALGVPSLIVSHEIDDVRQMCTRIENYTR